MSRRVSSLESSRYRALNQSILLWRVRCRQLATNSEAFEGVQEHTVPVRCRCQCETHVGPPCLPRSVSRQKEWRPRSFRVRRTAAVDTKRCRRTSQRKATLQEKLGKAQRCRCGQVPAAPSRASLRDTLLLISDGP